MCRLSVRSWALAMSLASALTPMMAGDLEHIDFIGTLEIAGDAVDLSGDDKLLENGEPRNRLGGFSALDYSSDTQQLAAMSDRGPDDGAVGYPCRVQLFEITVQPEHAQPVTARLKKSVLFTDTAGRPYTGSSAAIQCTSRVAHRLDPEGFRFGPGGLMFVSDEYGPEVIAFNPDGRAERRFVIPAHFHVAVADADKVKENRANKSGRASNRGMECLALSQDGDSLVGLMQSPLIQDGERTSKDIIVGRNCRIVKIDLKTGATQEFVYQMDGPENGNSEIVACGPDEFLVLERDSKAGTKADYRRLIQIDLSQATDVSAMTQLPHGDLPKTIVPVQRLEFLDFLDPRWKLAGDRMPEKIEGLTFGPTLPDGRRTLLISTDNDFESGSPSFIWVFATSDYTARGQD